MHKYFFESEPLELKCRYMCMGKCIGGVSMEQKGVELLHLEDGSDIVVSYFLEQFDDEYAKYGFYLEKEEEDIVLEKVHTGGFTDDKEVAEHILQLLMRNQITPCVLNEVLYDFLVERICG